MSKDTGERLSIEEAKEYNRNNYAARNKWRGCISRQACTNCGAVLSDSPCMCGWFGVCPVCKYEQPVYFDTSWLEKNGYLARKREPEYYI